VGTRITVPDLLEANRQNRKIAAISCCDYTTARLISATGVQMLLAGDSAARSMPGFDSTLPATNAGVLSLTFGA